MKAWFRRFNQLQINEQVVLACGVVCATAYLLNAVKR